MAEQTTAGNDDFKRKRKRMPATLRARAIFAVIALFGCTAVGWAQESTEPSMGSTLTVGSRVRLGIGPDQIQLLGIVLAVDDTVLTLAPDGRIPLEIPLDTVERLEMSAGRKNNTVRGLLIGGVGMGLLGLTFSVDPEDCGDDSMHFCSRAEAVGIGALTGVLFGAAIGGLIQTEQWIPLGVELQRPAPAGNPSGAAEVALSFAF